MSLVRDVTTVGSATLLSRLLGFLRDVGIAAVLGAGALSDAYFAALQIPNLFRRLLAEGALNAAFVPIWMRVREATGNEGTRRFGEQIFSVMFLALGLVSLLCILFAPVVVHLVAPGFRGVTDRFNLAVEFVRLSSIYVVVSGVIAVAASILNAEGRVAAAAFGLVIFNGILVAAVIAVLALDGTSRLAGDILSIAIAVAGLGQLVLIGGALLRIPQRPRRFAIKLSPDARRFFARALPGVLAGGIPQLKLMAGAMIASSSPASVSWLYYANRLYELPLGLVSVAIATVLAPRIAASVLSGDRGTLAGEQSRALEIAVGLALPSAVAFAVLPEAIAGGLFERGAFGPHDTAAVAAALTAICAGLPGHVLEKVFGAVSFAHEDTRTPMYAALAGLTVAATAGLLLFPHYGHVGVAAAIAVSGWVGATLLMIILWRRRWLMVDRNAWVRLPAITMASGLMGVVIVVTDRLLAGSFNVSGSEFARLATLAVLVVIGLAVYLVSLQALGIARVRDLLAAAKQRL